MADQPSMYDENERRRVAELIVGNDVPEGRTRAELIESLVNGLHPDVETLTIEEFWAEFAKLDEPDSPPPPAD